MEESDFDQMDREGLERDMEPIKCPECFRTVTQHELDMFGGLCEECMVFDAED